LRVREPVFYTKEKAQKTPLTGNQTPQKKAALLKDCFIVLSSKNDNPIKCQKAPVGSVQRAFIVGFSSPTKA